MRLGPSHTPNCRSEFCVHNNSYEPVKYSYKAQTELIELKPWWIQTSLYDNTSLYWACDKCYPNVPNM